jgi:hypothetical protein
VCIYEWGDGEGVVCVKKGKRLGEKKKKKKGDEKWQARPSLACDT